MTTKAGLVGLLAGLFATLILMYPLAIDGSVHWLWVAVVVAAAITIGGGSWAAKWSGSVQSVRCVALGALSGGLTGAVFFCLLGAATAGLAGFDAQLAQTEAIAVIVSSTQKMFVASFLCGIGLGSLGGWLTCFRREDQPDTFDKSEPQMAMNAAITAVPAAVVAAVLAAAVFSHLGNSIGGGAETVLNFPLVTSLMLVLIAQFALTLVIPHETREAEHRCGMDEVKMAAYVGSGTAPVLALLLLVVDVKLFLNSRVIVALLVSAVMSLKSLQMLFKLILPRRASLPAPQEDWQKTEAKFFGTIADSQGPRLIVLCIGCGFVMLLPLYVTVISVLVNLTSLMTTHSTVRKLFLTQALVSSSMVVTSVAILTAIYLFYLNLGRWFKGRLSRGSN